MDLIVYGFVGMFVAGFLFTRLMKSQAADSVLQDRVTAAEANLEDVRQAGETGWMKRYAKNRVYFAKLDARFKSADPGYRKFFYGLSLVIFAVSCLTLYNGLLAVHFL